jgi:glycosyltransferase involved in cell wall biosynthesis
MSGSFLGAEKNFRTALMSQNIDKIRASCCILTYNSARTLRRALESVKDFSEIIIADGGSTDDTLAIASEYGVKIIPQNGKGPIKDFSEVRNKCLDAITTDWFFYIDSDEEASPGLVEEIRNVVENPSPPALVYRMPSQIVYFGRAIKYSSSYPGYQVRFFNRRTGARFRKPVHERVAFDDKKYGVGRFNNSWRYFVEHRPDDPNRGYIERELGRHLTVSSRLTGIKNSFFYAVKIFLKASSIYARHGFKESMPLNYEWARIVYQVKLAAALFWDLFS